MGCLSTCIFHAPVRHRSLGADNSAVSSHDVVWLPASLHNAPACWPMRTPDGMVGVVWPLAVVPGATHVGGDRGTELRWAGPSSWGTVLFVGGSFVGVSTSLLAVAQAATLVEPWFVALVGAVDRDGVRENLADA